MSATDELRRLLDERGVEHYDRWSGEIRYTKWQGNYDMWFLTHDSFGTDEGLLYVQGTNMTPEQAIAATLGNDGVGRTNGGVNASDTSAVLQAVDRLRRELSGYHGQLKAHNDLQRHCDNQRERISELEGLYAKAKADKDEAAMSFCKEHDRAEFLARENARLRRLCKSLVEYTSQDRCEGCACKSRCNDGQVDECWMLAEIREIASESGLVVD